MAGDSNYQGGAAVRLDNFYNTLRQDSYRRQQAGLQEQQAKAKQRDETAKQLESLSAKLSTKGVRDNDVPYFAKKYDGIKALKAEIGAEENSVKRAEKTAIYEKEVFNYMSEADQSMGEKASQLKFKDKVAETPWAYTPETLQNFDKRLNTPTLGLNRWDENNWNAVVDASIGSKRLDDRINSVLKAQKESVTGTRVVDNGQKGVQRYITQVVAPAVAREEIVKGMTEDPQIAYSLRATYPQLNDQEIVEAEYNRYDKASKLQNQQAGGFTKDNAPEKESASDRNKNAKIDLREGNLRALVQNKDQRVFETVKASLPTNSKVKWLEQTITNTKTGVKTTKVVGIEVAIPKSYDKRGNLQGAIEQKIDFTKGDPMKDLNGIFNKYVGDDVDNEDLQQREVEGNTSKAKPATTTAKPKALTIKSTDIAGKAKASGYSVDEYKKLLKSKGVKVTN